MKKNIALIFSVFVLYACAKPQPVTTEATQSMVAKPVRHEKSVSDDLKVTHSKIVNESITSTPKIEMPQMNTLDPEKILPVKNQQEQKDNSTQKKEVKYKPVYTKVVELPKLDELYSPDMDVSIYFRDKSLKFKLDATIDDAASYDYPVVVTSRTKLYIDRYSNNYHNSFQRWIDKSNKYIYMVRDIFIREGLPQDLAYLPFAESGFEVHARSRAGAVGMWQFMESTGKLYGLNNNFWLDDRKDFEKATIAAARHLKDLYNSLGDWHLALAAYNAGLGRLQKGVNKFETNDFFELSEYKYLANETKDYVPKFTALLILYKNYLQYGFNPPETEPFLYEKLEVSLPVNLNVIAKFIDVDVDVLKELNPSLKRMITPPGENFVLKLPYGTKEKVKTKIETSSQDELLQFKIYAGKKKEKVNSIAKAFGVTASELKRVNGLKKDKLYASMPVLIPIKNYDKGIYSAVAKANFDQNKIFKEQDELEQEKYKVGRRDTAKSIAKRFNMSIKRLGELNKNVNLRKIRSGQIINVEVVSNDVDTDVKPEKNKSKTVSKNDVVEKEKNDPKKSSKNTKEDKRKLSKKEKSIKTVKKEKPLKAAKTSYQKYKVRAGDSMIKIAFKFNTNVDDIKSYNKLSKTAIKPGQVILIPN